MAFPQTPLPVFVDIAPGASPMGTTDSWDPYWVDITNDVRVAQKIVINEGIPDEANQADPGSCVLTLDNGISRVPATAGRIGCYTTRNPLGPYFGKLQKNTPLRVRIQRGRELFNRVSPGPGWGTATAGFTWSTNSVYYSVDGTRGLVSIPTNFSTSTTANGAGSWDFEMTGAASIDVTNSGGDLTQIVRFRFASSSNTYIMMLDWTPTGQLNTSLQRVIAGSTTTFASGGLGAITGGTVVRYRIKAEGAFVGAKVWLASGSEPTNWTMSSTTEGSWTLDNTSLGTNINCQTQRFTGAVAAVAYWSDITINSYPFIGTVPEWPVRWDQSGNDSTSPIKATGVLRRLQSGKSPVKSPLYSFIDGISPVALWTLEDDSGATLASSQTPNVQGGTIYSSTPGGWEGPPKLGGTSSQYTVDQNTTIGFTIPRMTVVDRWFAWFTFYMPVLPVTNPTIFRVRSSGTIVQWDMKISDQFGGVMYLVGQDKDGNVLVNQSITYVAGQWTVGQIEIQQTGSTFTGRIVNYQFADGGVHGATSAAVTGNLGVPNACSIYGSTGFQQSAAGPVAVWNTIPPVNIANLMLAGNGFAGEDAATRAARLAAEKGVRLDLISGGPGSSGNTTMGVQSSDQFLNVMGEIATTDIGLLTEFRGGLRYRALGRRYNQNARMALDFNAGHIKEPPEPVDDDQRLHNDITVSRKNGGSARAYDPVSIAALGQADTEVTINPATDDVLPGHAGFRLYLGTWNEMRWPQITLDLARNAGVLNYIERASALDPGAYVTLANPPTNLPIGTVDLLVEAIQTTLGPYEWTVELTCQPYGPWRITDSSNTTRIPRMDLVGSTLNSSELATAVGASDSWSISNTGNDWDYKAVPFDWMVNGERVTVTDIAEAALDHFTRTVASGWGTPDVGSAYSNTGGSASDFSVNGTKGVHTISTVNVSRRSLTGSYTNVDISVKMTMDQLATGGFISSGIIARFVDANNYYGARVEAQTSGAVNLTLRKVSGGTTTDIVSAQATNFTYAAGTDIMLRLRLNGTTLRVKAWLASQSEPYFWNISTTDSAVSGPGSAGAWTASAASNTNTSPTISFDDLRIDFSFTGTQTAIVTRGVNGITKAHSVGEPIVLADPLYVAL
jgi:hypothetical protein